MGGAWVSLILDLFSALDSGRTYEQPWLLQWSWRVCSGGGAVVSFPSLAAPLPACLLSTTGQGAPDGSRSELGLSSSATPPPPPPTSESFQLRWLDPPPRVSLGVPENLLSHEFLGALEFWKTAVPRSW